MGVQYSFNPKIVLPFRLSMDARPGEDLTVDLAIEKLSDSLRDAEYAIPVTHGQTFTWRRCAFQAHASPAQFPRDVQYVVDKLATEKPWRQGRYTPCGKLKLQHAWKIPLLYSS